jgi:iron(II)-dependent oxidoreductase
MGSLRKDGDRFGLEVPYDDTEVPQRRIWLDAYEIDRDEVSLGDYLVWRFKNRHAVPPELAQVLAATERIPDATVAAWPALYVSWSEAAEYCRAGGKRLPTEAEWEKAARGIAGQLFPWGRTAPDATRAVFGKDARSAIPPVTPVDSFAEGRSPYGLHHMAGNVAEWVQDWSGIDYYMSMPERNPPGPVGGQYKVVRGGSWRSVPVMLRTATRSGAPPEQRSPMIGFRCAK